MWVICFRFEFAVYGIMAFDHPTPDPLGFYLHMLCFFSWLVGCMMALILVSLNIHRSITLLEIGGDMDVE